MHEYDESIQVCDEDDEYEQLVTGHRRAGVSPLRRPRFQKQQQQHQRPSRASLRSRPTHNLESFEMSTTDEGSPAPPPIRKEEQKGGGGGGNGKKVSVKDFAPSPQQQLGDVGGKPENLISMASSYAKKLMSSGSDKKKEKPPPDVVTEGPKREQKGPPPPLADPKKPQQNPPPPSSIQPQQHQPPPSQTSRSEGDDDEDDDSYDMNMAQIEGLLRRVEQPQPPSNNRFQEFEYQVPQPPPGTPPSYSQRRPMFAVAPAIIQPGSVATTPQPYDRGGAGEPYSARTHQPQYRPPTASQQQPPPNFSQFHPGFGPATSSLMRGQFSDDDFSDTEISVTEGDTDFSRMEQLIDMYGADGQVVLDPAMMMAVPAPNINNVNVVDDEIMENMLTHRKMWEYSLDLKREKLRRKTRVMSDFLGVHAPGYDVYNPQDYEHLTVSPEIKELFHYIARYEPPAIGTAMDVKLKPFIPEYYPSVGDIDAFIKVLHPEVPDDGSGIKHLDEPAPFQSDPSVLDLRLRALAKQSSSKSVTVKKIDNVGKNAKIIENWIKDISDLHRSKPSPSVHYSKPMPDIDSLIQEWPPQLEVLLRNISLPSADLDCDLATYVDIVCNLLDIPVYKSRIQSLHVLFNMYATYKHFNHYGPIGGINGEGLMGSGNGAGNDMDDGEIDRLQINN